MNVLNDQDQKVITANEQIQKQFYDTDPGNEMEYLSEQTHQSKETMEANMKIQNRFYADKKRDDTITFYSNNNMAAVFLNEDEKNAD